MDQVTFGATESPGLMRMGSRGTSQYFGWAFFICSAGKNVRSFSINFTQYYQRIKDRVCAGAMFKVEMALLCGIMKCRFYIIVN